MNFSRFHCGNLCTSSVIDTIQDSLDFTDCTLGFQLNFSSIANPRMLVNGVAASPANTCGNIANYQR